MTVSGIPARAHGLNMEGLRRRGFPAEVRKQLKNAYKVLYREKLSLQDALVRLREMAVDCDEIKLLVGFIEKQTRGIVR